MWAIFGQFLQLVVILTLLDYIYLVEEILSVNLVSHITPGIRNLLVTSAVPNCE